MISQGARGRSAALFVAVGQRLSAVAAPGRAVPRRKAIRCCICPNPTGVEPRRPAGGCSIRCARSNEHEHARVMRSGDQRPHRAVRDGVPDADDRAGRDGSAATSRTRRLDLYGPDARKPGHVRRELPARAAAGRARRAVRPALPPRLGPARQSARATSGSVREGRRSAVGGAGDGSEAARPARRHAGDLGRRVRPHGLFARAS